MFGSLAPRPKTPMDKLRHRGQRFRRRERLGGRHTKMRTPKLVAAGLVTNFEQVRSMRLDGTSGRNMSGRHLHVCELRDRRNNERVQRHRRLARGAWVSTQCWRGLLVRARPSGRRSARGRACFTCMHTLLESGNGWMHGIGSQGCCLLLVPCLVGGWRRHGIPNRAGGATLWGSGMTR